MKKRSLMARHPQVAFTHTTATTRHENYRFKIHSITLQHNVRRRHSRPLSIVIVIALQNDAGSVRSLLSSTKRKAIPLLLEQEARKGSSHSLAFRATVTVHEGATRIFQSTETVDKTNAMDPYDDFDPTQYVYDEGSSQEDEDDIVYLEGPAPGEDPFLPYLAKDNADLSQQQTQSQTQPTEQQLPSLLPRRERKRRQAAAQMLGESSDSESSNSPAHNEEQDAFASLQSFLENQSQKRKGTRSLKRGGENESGGEHQDGGSSEEEAETVLARRADSATENENSVPAVEDRGNDKFTQSEFPMADDWDPSQAEPKESTIPLVASTTQQAISDLSVELGLERELQRQRERKQAASQSRQITSADSRRPRTFDTNPKSRPARHGPDWSKQRTFGGLDQPLSLSMSQAPFANSASIVGSR